MSYSRQRQPAYGQQRRRPSAFSGLKLRVIIGGAILLFSVVSFLNKGQINPITGEKQRVNWTVAEEIQIGRNGVSELGQRSLNREAQRHVETVGYELIRELEDRLNHNGIELPYPFEFHLLADRRVNAFAMPGGQVFITEELYRHLNHDGQLAGVLGHEIGHVIERHGAQKMAKGSLLRDIADAVSSAAGSQSSGYAAAWVGNLVNMKYGREDELESDRWGVELMVLAGYDPEHLLTVMDILESTSGGGGTPEFMSTHPRPENRRQYIQEIIAEKFPNGMNRNLR